MVMTMIRYTERLGNKSAKLECETMEQLIQYLKTDKSEVVNVSDDKVMTSTGARERVNNAPNHID